MAAPPFYLTAMPNPFSIIDNSTHIYPPFHLRFESPTPSYPPFSLKSLHLSILLNLGIFFMSTLVVTNCQYIVFPFIEFEMFCTSCLQCVCLYNEVSFGCLIDWCAGWFEVCQLFNFNYVHCYI